MMYLGDYAAGSTVRVPFATALASGVRGDFNNTLEIADILIYKDAGTTERSSTSGYTIATPFDSKTGINFFTVDTSDNADAGFFAAGHDYTVVAYPDETLDSLAVSAVLACFSIENRVSNVTKWLGTAVAAPTVAGIPKVEVSSLLAAAIKSIFSHAIAASHVGTLSGAADTSHFSLPNGHPFTTAAGVTPVGQTIYPFAGTGAKQTPRICISWSVDGGTGVGTGVVSPAFDKLLDNTTEVVVYPTPPQAAPADANVVAVMDVDLTGTGAANDKFRVA